MAIKICLDAGHYGKYNRSPVVPEYYESDMNWKLHLLLKAELEKYGMEVITTRANKGKDLGLESRGKASAGCDLFLSLHSNAADNESVDYPVVYVMLDGKGDVLGKSLASVIEGLMGTRQAGMINTRKGNRGEYYGVLRGAASVGTMGMIIEHSFHTNTKSANWLMDDENLRKLATAEAQAIAYWFGAEKQDEHWYRIREAWDKPQTQKGAYKNLENAKRACTDGYGVFDWNGVCVYERFGKYESEEYTLSEFVKDIQKACGAAVDGIAGPETLSKTVTLSASKNRKHAAVKPVQERLYHLGYHEVGKADGIAGPMFTEAVKALQRDNGCYVDGEITANNTTWKKLLGMT